MVAEEELPLQTNTTPRLLNQPIPNPNVGVMRLHRVEVVTTLNPREEACHPLPNPKGTEATPWLVKANLKAEGIPRAKPEWPLTTRTPTRSVSPRTPTPIWEATCLPTSTENQPTTQELHQGALEAIRTCRATPRHRSPQPETRTPKASSEEVIPVDPRVRDNPLSHLSHRNPRRSRHLLRSKARRT